MSRKLDSDLGGNTEKGQYSPFARLLLKDILSKT